MNENQVMQRLCTLSTQSGEFWTLFHLNGRFKVRPGLAESTTVEGSVKDLDELMSTYGLRADVQKLWAPVTFKRV